MDMLNGIEARFWAKVNKRPGGCWLWAGSTEGGGYGTLWIPSLRTVKKAHRLAYAHLVGPIPDGLNVCHRCDTPACVNPEHLFVGTQADNIADKLAKGRQTRGESHGPSKLTRAAVREIRTSSLSRAALAEKFGVCVEAISHAANGKTWGHVAAPPRNRSTKLTEDEADEIRRSRDKGVDLAKRYGVAPSTISRIRNGVRRPV